MLPDVHLINPMGDHTGGSEHRTLTLYRLLLAEHGGQTRIWCLGAAHPQLAAVADITAIELAAACHPRDGILVFVGAYFPFGGWLHACQPERIVVIVNLFEPYKLLANLHTLREAGHQQVELVYTSQALQQAMRAVAPGAVLHSLIDPTLFPAVEPDVSRAFTVGRLSRDLHLKHHAEDVIVYQDVIARGGGVALMGASSLHPQPQASPRLHVLAAGEESASAFLARLDCFYYRTAPEWFETFGRVIHEAMCSGLPVLCHRSVGGAAQIEHGVNGLLFETTGEALDLLDRLRRDIDWRQQLGALARVRMLALHGEQWRVDTLKCVFG